LVLFPSFFSVKRKKQRKAQVNRWDKARTRFANASHKFLLVLFFSKEKNEKRLEKERVNYKCEILV